MPKVALVQMSCNGSVKENTDKALALVKQAAEKGADIVVLPELFQNPYFPIVQSTPGKDSHDLAEPVNGETMKRLSQAAKENHVHLIGGSIYERDGEGKNARYYNTALSFDDEGNLIGNYRKCHIPQDPGFYEKEYFEGGDTIPVMKTKHGNIAVMICFDQWHPEAARIAALKGANLIVYPTAIGIPQNEKNITGDWRAMWQNAQCGHAAANQVYVAAANRIGREEAPSGLTDFFGGSFIADWTGQKLAQLDKEEGITMLDCDFEHQKQVQEAWCILPNRRPDIYASHELATSPRPQLKTANS